MAEALGQRRGNPSRVPPMPYAPGKRQPPSPTGAAQHSHWWRAGRGTVLELAVTTGQWGLWGSIGCGRSPGRIALLRGGRTRSGQIDFGGIRRIVLRTAQTLVARCGFRPAEFQIDLSFVKGVGWRRHGLLYPSTPSTPQCHKQQSPSQKLRMFSDLHRGISFPPIMSTRCRTPLPVSHTIVERCKPMSLSRRVRQFAKTPRTPARSPTGAREDRALHDPVLSRPAPGHCLRPVGCGARRSPPPVGRGAFAAGQAHTERW